MDSDNAVIIIVGAIILLGAIIGWAVFARNDPKHGISEVCLQGVLYYRTGEIDKILTPAVDEKGQYLTCTTKKKD